MSHHRNRWAAQRTAVLLGTGALLAAAWLPSSAAGAVHSHLCGDVQGAPYNFIAPGHRRLSGDRYRVELLTTGVSCSFAKARAAHLTYARPGAQQPDGGRLLKGGPTGWKCEGKSYTYNRLKPPTISGDCYQGSIANPTRFFNWGIYGA